MLFVNIQKNAAVHAYSPRSPSTWLLALLMLFFFESALAAESEIQFLAAEAKQRFAKVIQPQIFENTLPMHAFFLESTARHRDYVVSSFNEAIDALIAEADRPERMPVVTNALNDLIKHGETEAVDRVFSEMLARELAVNKKPNPQAAAVLRHSVALVELPIALQPVTFPALHPITLSPFVRLTLNGAISNASGMKPMPGPKTLPAYKNAAVHDAGHLWTWLVIANLAQHPLDFEDALAKAEALSIANNDNHTLVFVKKELGRLRNKFKFREEASQAYKAAVDIALKGLTENPEDGEWKHSLASALIGLGGHFATTGFGSKEHAAAAAALELALNLRSQLAAGQPENTQLSLELATAHSRLAAAQRLLSGKVDNDIESNRHNTEAERIYNSLTASDSFKPTLQLQTGTFVAGLMWAGGLTLMLGFTLILLYRWRISHWMRAAASAKTVSSAELDKTSGQMREHSRTIEFSWLSSDTCKQNASCNSTQMSGARRHLRRAGLTYILGGVVFALIAAMLNLSLAKIEIIPIRLIAVGLNYAWPVVLTLWLIWGPDRKRLAMTLLVYFGLLLMVCVWVAFSETPPLNVFGMMLPAFFQPLIPWLLTASPSLFLLLFLNRHIRAVGPVVLVLMSTLVAGSTLMIFIGSSPVGMTAWVNLSMWLDRITGVSGMLSNGLWWMALSGALLAAPVAGWLVRALCRRYEQKKFSEMTLIIDSIWIFEAGYLCIDLSHNDGYGYWFGWTAFAGYKLVTALGLRPLAREAVAATSARLLLLRVFGFKRRTERLLKLLEARWRYAGPIQLIAAPDLASSTADPGDFLRFITGKLHRQFIIEPDSVAHRLAQMDDAPDPDGRYRVNEVFCGNDAWRPAVQQLMTGSDLVVMDLRSFSAGNQGCLFELQALVDYVPFDRMVLLVDDSTDTGLLSQTLTERWRQADTCSPNAQGQGIIAVLKVGRRDESAIDTLLEIADKRLIGTGLQTRSA